MILSWVNAVALNLLVHWWWETVVTAAPHSAACRRSNHPWTLATWVATSALSWLIFACEAWTRPTCYANFEHSSWYAHDCITWFRISSNMAALGCCAYQCMPYQQPTACCTHPGHMNQPPKLLVTVAPLATWTSIEHSCPVPTILNEYQSGLAIIIAPRILINSWTVITKID